MAVGVSVHTQSALPTTPRDRCSYPRPFSPDFTDCPAYQAATFIAVDSDGRDLHTHLTCRHLEIGTDLAQAGRFYPRCDLGDPGQRRRWVARVGLERLEVMRTLQQEFDRFSDSHQKRLYQVRDRLRAEPTDRQLREEMDRMVAEYREAIAGFLQEREERFRDAGLPIAPLQDLIEESLTTWARHLLSRPSGLDAARLRAFSPEAQAFLGTALGAPWKAEASTAEVLFDDGMLEIAQAGDQQRLMISGEIDVSNSDAVAVELARESGLEELWIDLSGVLFSDLSGVRAILGAAGRVSGRSTLRLYRIPDQLRRTMELAGLRSPAFLRRDDLTRASATYSGLVKAAGSLPALSPPPPEAGEIAFDSRSLRSLRAAVMHHSAQVGLPSARMADLVVAINEVATNSVRHGGGGGRLRQWRDGGAIVCEVRDAGRMTNPLIYRVRPDADPRSSRGLWLANQLCDLVQVRSLADGSVVRLRMRGRRPIEQKLSRRRFEGAAQPAAPGPRPWYAGG
jgi:anti-anti-sigma factor